MSEAADRAAAAATRQQTALAKLTAQLETLKGKARRSVLTSKPGRLAGQDDLAFATALPAYQKVNTAIEQYAMRQREAKVAAEQAAAGEPQMRQRSRSRPPPQPSLARWRAIHSNHEARGGRSRRSRKAARCANTIIRLFRRKPERRFRYSRTKRQFVGLIAQFAGFYGVIEALKSGLRRLNILKVASAFAADLWEALASNLSMSRLKPIGLTLVHRTNAAIREVHGRSIGRRIGQSAQRQIFEAFAEAARVRIYRRSNYQHLPSAR